MIKDKVSERKVRRLRAKRAIRKKVFGCAEKPRLVIFKSHCYIYAQAIDDQAGHTMAAASSREEGFTAEGKALKNVHAAKKVGEIIGERLLEKGIKNVVFDRNGYRYHGKVKSLAEGAREKGLQF